MKRKKFKLRSYRLDGRTVISCTVTVALAGILSRLLSGSPLPMLRISGIGSRIPPIWVISLIWLAFYSLLGFVLGCVLGDRNRCTEVHKYKGSFWFVIMLVFNLVWYPLFFRAGAIFLALVDLALILLFAFLAATEFLKVKREYGICIFIHVIWLIYCFILNLIAFVSV